MSDQRAAAQLVKGVYAIEQGAWRWTAKDFAFMLKVPADGARKGATLNFKFTIPDVVLTKVGPSVTLACSVGGAPLPPETDMSHNGWYAEMPPALAEAKRTGNDMIIDFGGSDWCEGCKLLKENILDKPEFNQRASRQFVLVDIDTLARGLSPERKARYVALQKKYKVGQTIKLYEREFTIVGTYEPAAGARIKIPLTTMQSQLGAEGKVTAFLVKISPGQNESDVAQRLHAAYPENQIILTRDLEELYMQGFPALNVFLNVFIGVAAVISALVILLTMYTTVTERTRQIGIMKSLGMSNAAIGWTITQEALLISLIGITTGIILTYLLRFGLTRITTLEVEMSSWVMLITFVVGMLGGALGGLYPAMRAARLDAVEALSYE